MSLRRRMMALILMLLPLSLLTGGLATYFYSVRQVENEITAATSLAETSARDVVATLPKVADPSDQIVRLVSSFDNDRDIKLSFVAPDGNIILSSRPARLENPAPHFLQRAFSGPARVKVIEFPDPLRQLGTLRIEAMPLGEITEAWEEMVLQFSLIAFLVSAFSAIVFWTLGRALQPLEKLSGALSQVGQGNFAAQVPESGPEELSAIYRAFNSMAGKLQDAERQNLMLNDQLSTVQEEERAEIARDLHDEIGPFLFAVDVDAQAIPQYLSKGQHEEATGRAAAVRQSVAHMQTHLRAILGRLRPAALLDLGLAQAVDRLASFWKTRYPGLRIAAEMQQASFGARLDEIAYRTIQEALNNSVRHGQPDIVTIKAELSADRVLTVTVTDDGSGFGKDSAPGFGLAGMRERIAAAGGTLDIAENHPKSGVTITARLPAANFAGERSRDKQERTTAS